MRRTVAQALREHRRQTFLGHTRPPREWWEACMAGVESSGKARDARRVCGATWAALSRAKKLAIKRAIWAARERRRKARSKR